MYIKLNLATRPLLSQRRFLVGSAILGVVGLLLFASLGWRVYSLRVADRNFRERAAKVQQEMTSLQQQRDEMKSYFERTENKNLDDRAKFIDSVIESWSFDWTKMFMNLEHTLPPGVHVIRIEPRQDRGTVEVKFLVGAGNPEAQFKLLKAFEDSKSFTHVELLAAETPRQNTSDAMIIEFSAIYTGI